MLLQHRLDVGAEDLGDLGLEVPGEALDEVAGGAAAGVHVGALEVAADELLRVVLEKLGVDLKFKLHRFQSNQWLCVLVK